VGVLKLIESIKQNPATWDVRGDAYKLAERKAIIWRDITAKLGSDASEHT